jgi:YHS domain-containing protein
VNPKLSVAYRGGKVLFCCGMCVKEFAKSPAKFAASANLQLVASGQAVQQKCPICGGKADSQCIQKIAGQTVQFCNATCRDKVAKVKAAEQFQMVFGNAGFDKGFAVTVKQAPQPMTATTTTSTGSDSSCCCCERPPSAAVAGTGPARPSE